MSFLFMNEKKLLDMIENHLTVDEDIFVECRPNKLFFILSNLKKQICVVILTLIIIGLAILIYPFLGKALGLGLGLVAYIIAGAAIIYILYSVFILLIRAKNSYYVITTRGIHILYFDSSVKYNFFTYDDIKNVRLENTIFDIGNIIIRDNSSKKENNFFKNFLSDKKGLIAIDEAQKVFDVLRQIALQVNASIFFASKNDSEEDVEYFDKNIKKYNKELKNIENDSLIERRKEK